MKQAFIALEHLVVKYLPDHFNLSFRRQQKQAQLAHDKLNEACSVFLDALSDAVLNSADAQKGAQILVYYQRRVIKLTDRLKQYYDAATAPDISRRKEGLLHATGGALVNLLADMKDDFASYFDDDLNMPYVGWLEFRDHIEEKRKELKELLDEAGVNNELPEVFDTWLGECITARSCSFRKAAYVVELLHAIFDKSLHTGPLQSRHIHDLMAQHNINHSLFVNYLCNRIARKLEVLRDDHTRGKMIRIITGRIEMATYGERLAADEAAPGLKKQLLQWLQIQSLEYENTLLSMADGNDASENGRLKLGFTGLELGCFLNIAVGNGIIKSNNKKRDIEIASRIFATIGQEDMSSESLYTAFYTIKPSAMESVKVKLLAMVNSLIKRAAEAKRAAN